MAASASRRKIVSHRRSAVSADSAAVHLHGAECLQLTFSTRSPPARASSSSAFPFVAFLLFVAVLVLLVRNVLKLYADQRSRVMGTRLRTRMLWGAVLVSLIPLVFMFLFSYGLMNRAVDRWFSQNPDEMRNDSTQLALELAQYTSANARAEAQSIAASCRRCRRCDPHGSRSPRRAAGSACRSRPTARVLAHSMRSRCRMASPSSIAKAIRLPRFTCRSTTARQPQVKPWLPDLRRTTRRAAREPMPAHSDRTRAGDIDATILAAAQRTGPAHLLARRYRLRAGHRAGETGRHGGRGAADAERHVRHHGALSGCGRCLLERLSSAPAGAQSLHVCCC